MDLEGGSEGRGWQGIWGQGGSWRDDSAGGALAGPAANLSESSQEVSAKVSGYFFLLPFSTGPIVLFRALWRGCEELDLRGSVVTITPLEIFSLLFIGSAVLVSLFGSRYHGYGVSSTKHRMSMILGQFISNRNLREKSICSMFLGLLSRIWKFWWFEQVFGCT